MSEKKDLLDEIFSLMHQQIQARQDGIVPEQAGDYEKRATRIDQLINRLIGKRAKSYRTGQYIKQNRLNGGDGAGTLRGLGRSLQGTAGDNTGNFGYRSGVFTATV